MKRLPLIGDLSMGKAIYFIAFAWLNMKNSISFGNGSIEEFPPKWLKEMQENHPPDKQIRLIWWKQLTDEDEINAAKSIGMTAI
jgi:hypothetical protein